MNVLAVTLAAILAQASSIGGGVTKAGSTEPLANVTLELRAADAGDSVQYTVISADDGKFSFRNVKAGKYRLVANRSGYVRIEYGQRKQSGRGTPTEIVAGQNLSDLKISMTPTGAIYGRIYGANGRPVVKAEVQALKPAYQNGRRVLSVVQSTLANDLGEYRLFWLPPGQYYVGAAMVNWNLSGNITVSSSTAPAPAGSAVIGSRYGTAGIDPLAPARLQLPADTARYQTVYFPNTTDDQAAEAIDLRPGANLGGMDITISPVRTRRVRGAVIDGETGQPPKLQTTQPVQVSTTPSVGAASSSPFANTTTGAFETQILPAPTILSARLGLKIGRVSIPFGDTDLEEIRIIINSGYTLPGQITVEGAAAGGATPNLAPLRVALRPEPQMIFVAAAQDSGVPSSTGTFTVQDVFPGDYRVNVGPLLNIIGTGQPVPAAFQKWYVKSIRYGDSDALNDLLHLDGRPNQSLTIVLGTNAGSLTGDALNERQEPLPDATVVLVPANRSRIDLFRSVTTDASGKFSIDRVPPGDYKAFAWDDVINGAWSDPQFMRAYEGRGTAVRIAEGDKQDIRLPVIPPR